MNNKRAEDATHAQNENSADIRIPTHICSDCDLINYLSFCFCKLTGLGGAHINTHTPGVRHEKSFFEMNLNLKCVTGIFRLFNVPGY